MSTGNSARSKWIKVRDVCCIKLLINWLVRAGRFIFFKPGGEEVNHTVNKGQNLMTKILDKVGRLVFKGRMTACSLRVGGRIKGGSAFLGLPLEV